jgi:uncharacterized protein
MKTPQSLKNSVWGLLIAPPILFLIVVILVSVYYAFTVRGDAAAIAEKSAAATPAILVAVQGILLGLQLVVFRRQGMTMRDLGWRAAPGQTAWREIALGVVFGAPLGAIYIYLLEPLMELAQRTLGDYVPAGSLLPALGASTALFFIADVLLAPFVEENIYRGYALSRLMPRLGTPTALILSCVLFGLFHWAGGIWYILLTGIVAGGLFAGLYARRGNILAPFGAHLALNLVEFLLLWLAR